MRVRVATFVILLAGCSLDASGLGAGGSETTRGEEPSSGGTTRGTGSSGAGEDDVGESSTGVADTGSTSTGEGSGASSGDTTGDVPRELCPTEVGLIACYDFAGVGGGMLVDGSGLGNHGSATRVSVVPGPFGEAATFDDDSRISVPDAGSLDVAGPLTVEAWIIVDALPSGRMGVMDKDGQYSMTIQANGSYRCSANAEVLAGTVTMGTWLHMACVYDGATMRVFVDGVELGRVDHPSELSTGSTNPMSIGDTSPEFAEPLQGAIGGLRIWSRALEAAELCEAAGRACTG